MSKVDYNVCVELGLLEGETTCTNMSGWHIGTQHKYRNAGVVGATASIGRGHLEPGEALSCGVYMPFGGAEWNQSGNRVGWGIGLDGFGYTADPDTYERRRSEAQTGFERLGDLSLWNRLR